MNPVAPQDIIDHLNWRYAAKTFDPTRKISPPVWEALEASLHLAPSSYGLQPWKFVIVQDETLKKALTPASWNQPQIESCSHLVVLTHLKDVTNETVDTYMDLISSVRGTPLEKLDIFKSFILRDVVNGPRHAQIADWAARQTYIAMGAFLTTAAMLSIDTCPLEGISPDEYDAILDIPKEYRTVTAIATGYRSESDVSASAPKVRFPKSDLFIYK